MNDSEPYQRARAAALRFLSYRPRSEAEVRTRLRRRFPAPVVQQVIDTLREQDLLNDPTFARQWKEHRESLSPRSASAVNRELISKGVAREVAEVSVREMDDADSAYRAGLKHARRLHSDSFDSFRRKLWGYLQRRGFSSAVARQTIARLWDERRESV